MIYKRNNQIQYILTFILSAICFFNSHAELSFNSQRIKQVYNMLPDGVKRQIEVIDKSKPGTFFLDCGTIEKNRELTFRINQFKEVDHLGFHLFGDRKSFSQINEVLDYVERSFLVSAINKESILLADELKKNRIEVLYNGSDIRQKNGYSVQSRNQVDRTTPLKIHYDSKSFKVKWLFESTNTLEIVIPNNYSLITEKDKNELESELIRQMKSIKSERINREYPTKDQLKSTSHGLYILTGEIYSTTPELTSSKYFVAADSIYPVFQQKYYKESVQNLFLNQIQTLQKLNVTQKLYGGVDDSYTIDINSFLGNFSSNYRIYFGWQSDTKDNLKASIFICNSIYNYNHILVVSTNSKEIFKKNNVIEGMLFPFVPREIELKSNQ